MDEALKDHEQFADALFTLFDSDVANGGTNSCPRDQVIDRLHAVLALRAVSPIDLLTLARAMLATYEATIARMAARETKP